MQVILFLLPSLFLCGTFAAKNDNYTIQNLIERLDVLETEVKQLRAKKCDGDDSLEKRVEKLEELSKFKTLRSCQELSNRGLTKSGLFDIDPDGDELDEESIVIHQQPASGTLSVEDGRVTYTPDPGSTSSSDVFTYTVADETGLVSNIATCQIVIS